MSLRHALLGLLDTGPASGYDLMRTFNSTLSAVWPATQSQVYTDLNRLAEAGQIRVAAEGPRGRKSYEITAAGREELRHWLLEVAPDGYRRNDVLLRVFLLGAVSPSEAREFLRQRHAISGRHRAALEERDAGTDWDDDPLSVYGRLTLEWGKRFMTMQQEWSAWALEQLEKAPPHT
ncbi:PadR family transcriptional regulator [Mangrovactinospora gilvigrisea]|uniref:PadR family transcriptional regulator n=1 Tax=Mangrovactinospora gilvigrisea TaxID=1428644 RepID=A0A1J7C7T6_9ACTN|nr:PadR family transcriptional regulator [Mangrovactinospora gilvigrisea]OIV35706.1 PadR family transcriptional regulator [Mangrovactinospora gilvigrisea]